MFGGLATQMESLEVKVGTETRYYAVEGLGDGRTERTVSTMAWTS